jgi:hypothetical protein
MYKKNAEIKPGSKMNLFLIAAQSYLFKVVFNFENPDDLRGFAIQQRAVTSSAYNDIRFDFKLRNKIVFSKTVRYFTDEDIVFVKPKTTLKDIDILPIVIDAEGKRHNPRGLSDVHMKIIHHFLDICKEYGLK